MKNFGRKLYSITEFYRICYLTFFSIPTFIITKKNKILSDQLAERVMLAVTEVNGCAFCSYAHTKMALETGIKDKEIQNMLAGINDDVPKGEMAAVVFGQHYADSRGYPSKKSWETVIKTYGKQKAEGILASIRIVTLGNAAGVPWGSFIKRFKNKPDKRSNLPYEIAMILASIVFPIIAAIHALIAIIIKRPVIKFKNK